MRVFVQQGKIEHTVELDVDDPKRTKVEMLQDVLEEKTGILKRQQKLILKGRVLLPHQTFHDSKASTLPMT